MKPIYRILCVTLIVAAATAHLLNTGYRDWNSGGDLAYVLGLLVLFFWKETIEDERVRELKLKALTVAFCFGYVATIGAKLWLNTRPDLPRSASAYDLMFIVLLTAFSLFHYWRWRDGRPENPVA